MKRSVTALASIALALAVGGCGLFGDKSDAKKEWTAAEYYGAAKQEFEKVRELQKKAEDSVMEKMGGAPPTLKP